MKKILVVIIASAILMSGCNNSEFDNRPNSIPPSSESGAQTNGHSTIETVGSETISETSEEQNPTKTQHTSTNEPIASSTSDNPVSTSGSKSESTVSTTSTVSSSSTIKLPESSSTVSSNINVPEPPTNTEENALNITITVNERKFSATLYDNETAKAFKARLPITLDMSELNGNEKYYYLSDSLPTNSSRPSKIDTGDIMLYGSSCLVIFYESFSTSYSYTPIGKISDPNGLAAALGSGSVQVVFN